jgi:hypothetical protein
VTADQRGGSAFRINYSSFAKSLSAAVPPLRSEVLDGRFYGHTIHFGFQGLPIMNSLLTDIVIVLDRSGSMDSVRDATIEAFNSYVKSQQQGEGKAQLSLIQFDDQYETPLACVPIASVPRLNHSTYEPRGSTALFDAIGRTIVATGARLAAMSDPERPSKVLFVIQTDGYENASQEFHAHQIQEMIAHQRDKYGWQFVFLGANQDAIMSAAQFGIPAASSLSYGATAKGTMAAFDILGARTRAYRAASTSADAVQAWTFSDEERRRAED